MKKNAIKIATIISIIVASATFFTTYFILEKEPNVKEKDEEKKQKIVSYELKKPTLPLKDIYKKNYITSTSVNVEDSFDNWSYTIYINDENKLIIKNNKTNEEKKATTVENAKYIINEEIILTNDGKIYAHNSDERLYTYEQLSFQDIDSYQIIEENKDGIIFTNAFEIIDGIEEFHSLIGETTEGSYYNLSAILCITEKTCRISSSEKSKNMDELINKYHLNVISSDYGNNAHFNVYSNGKITCKGKYKNGDKEEQYELEIYDENQNKLTGYKYIYMINANVDLYFISLENKLYSLNYRNIQYDTKVIATLINENEVTKISYDKSNKNSITFTFSNNETIEITKINENKSYNMFLN